MYRFWLGKEQVEGVSNLQRGILGVLPRNIGREGVFKLR